MGKSECRIGKRVVGRDYEPFVVAEIGQAHEGSLGTAHAYIDAVAKSGADAIKFQTHIAEAESSPGEAFRLNVFPQDNTRYDYWKRMEFTPEQWEALAQHATDEGLIFLSTPFSMEAVDLLEDIGVPAWKVGSGEVTNKPMLIRMAETGKPVLLSSGMSTWAELDQAIKWIEPLNSEVAIFQCTTSYPCPPEQLGLNALQSMLERFPYPIGLSDHSGTVFGSLAAIALGASLIEIHTTFSKQCFGPDVSSSITLDELSHLCDGAKFIHTANQNPVDKDQEAHAREDLRILFSKSLVAKRRIELGATIEEEDVALKKPGTGIPAARLSEFIGRRATRAYEPNDQLLENEIE